MLAKGISMLETDYRVQIWGYYNKKVNCFWAQGTFFTLRIEVQT